ncbi:MAG: hypothetical protein LBR86_06105, partial [Tannerella sp.]|nr:hypothetical protein [Tannerella sp.]
MAGCRHASADSTVAMEGKIRIPSGALEGITYKAGITAAERKRLCIDDISTDEVKAKSGKEIARGKAIYTGEEGRLETFAVIEVDHGTFTYLASYDADGKLLDCIQTGAIMAYSDDTSTGAVEGNRVNIRYRWSEPLAEWGEGISRIYMITDDLHFVPFGWPPESFPCEIPFMTHEYDGGIPFCWQI